MLTLSKSLVHCKFYHFKCTLGWVEVSPEMSQTSMNYILKKYTFEVILFLDLVDCHYEFYQQNS